MSAPIHIVEPTFRDKTGHCYSHISSVLLAADDAEDLRFEIWAGKGTAGLFASVQKVTVHPVFGRIWKRPKTLLLYRRLLRRPGKMYVPTASRRDLVMLDLAAAGAIPPNKVYLLFHWLKLTEAKQRHLRRIAARQPGLVIIANSDALGEKLRRCGFEQTRVVSYPLLPAPQDATDVGATFRHVLFAGAARVDKGFDRVHALIAHFMKTDIQPPFLVQVSPPHTGALEPEVQKSMHELDALGYPHMRKNTQTLHEDEYFDQFRGGICLQLYDPAAFAVDRVSGVTLDALGCGCPVIATAGTWMAKVVERFDAGVVIADRSAPAVAEVVGRIVNEYAAYHRRALEGGRVLRQEHDARHLLKIVMGDEG